MSFAAGTYYLVIDGPAGPGVLNSADWFGRSIIATLAPGFSVAGGSHFDLTPDAFAPASDFSIAPTNLVFELSVPDASAPAPVTLALFGFGLAALAWTRRRQ